MTGPFDTDATEEADALEDDTVSEAGFDEGDQDDGYSADMTGVDMTEAGASDFDEGEAAAEAACDRADDFGDQSDDMILWIAFEQDAAGGLDAAGIDEFVVCLLGALNRAGGLAARGDERAATGRSPTVQAAARIAAVIERPGDAPAGTPANAHSGAPGLLAGIGRLLRGGVDDADAFDEMADLVIDDGIDAALPIAVALVARAAAGALSDDDATRLTPAARRALVRGVGAAAHELVREGGTPALRALPRLVQAAARAAQRGAETSEAAARTMRCRLPAAARRLAREPRLMQRLELPAGHARDLRSRPPLGASGMSAARPGRVRTFNLPGPITLTMVTPR
jgi:hypothetical protein